MQVWIILLWMICDLYMAFLYLYPLYEKGETVSKRKKKELTVFVSAYVLLRPLSVMFSSQGDIGSSSVLTSAVIMVCEIARATIVSLYMYRNMHAGVNLSVFSMIVSKMCFLACDCVSEWIHVRYMAGVPVMEAQIGMSSISFSPDTVIVSLVMMTAAAVMMNRIFVSSRKMEDESFGKMGIPALLELFVMITLHGNYVFEPVNTYVKEEGMNVLRVVSNHTLEDITVIAVMVLLPLSILMIFHLMMTSFFEKQQRIQAEKMSGMEEEQLKLMEMLQNSRLQEKHAVAEHLNVVRMFLENGDQQAAQLYIQKTAGIMDDPVPIYCGNPYLNMVICCRMKSDPDIVFDVQSAIGEETGMDSLNLGILLLNLLDIRIGEIRRHGFEKKITLRIRKRENMVTMYVDSTTSKSHLSDCSLEYSVIENILHQYHGEMYHGLEKDTDTVLMLRTEVKK